MKKKKLEAGVELVEAKQRWTIRPHTSGAQDLGYAYEALSHHMNPKTMAPYLVKIPPSNGRSIEPSSHDGEEFLFVLSGRLIARIEGQDHALKKGDSLYFNPSLQHSFLNDSQKNAKILVCLVNKSLSSHQNDPFSSAMGQSYE